MKIALKFNSFFFLKFFVVYVLCLWLRTQKSLTRDNFPSVFARSAVVHIPYNNNRKVNIFLNVCILYVPHVIKKENNYNYYHQSMVFHYYLFFYCCSLIFVLFVRSYSAKYRIFFGLCIYLPKIKMFARKDHIVNIYVIA